ncbi:MAG: SPOR domain-containing protein [Endozoicomonadaceae bacterium]|nr:SPOR domain-containing protein [Endozoicomonadaceae bacterium]
MHHNKMRHNKKWNRLLSVVSVIYLVMLPGCAKEKLEPTKPQFNCASDPTSNTWKCTGSGKMVQNDLQQTFIIVDDDSVQDTMSMTEPPEANAPKSKAEKSKASVATLESRLNVQPTCQPSFTAEHFYLQFSATKTENGLKLLAARLFPVETEIVSTTTKGEDWFLLVSAGFSSHEAAQSVASLLQSKGVKKPWIRSGNSLLSVLKHPVSTSECQ